ncbi:hypothetical protein LVISKB_1058 [Levilactobacillus brevis KB290]|uniref:Uncharacterized protein n=1 Tax=Levilactobacillus brevis KB290 TaxID=1001583 RepID=M5AD02_LEVBR|nr:hypothetical protein LVISKB_1058 [Levilactobacillus brevis KB290]
MFNFLKSFGNAIIVLSAVGAFEVIRFVITVVTTIIGLF